MKALGLDETRFLDPGYWEKGLIPCPSPLVFLFHRFFGRVVVRLREVLAVHNIDSGPDAADETCFDGLSIIIIAGCDEFFVRNGISD